MQGRRFPLYVAAQNNSQSSEIVSQLILHHNLEIPESICTHTVYHACFLEILMEVWCFFEWNSKGMCDFVVLAIFNE